MESPSGYFSSGASLLRREFLFSWYTSDCPAPWFAAASRQFASGFQRSRFASAALADPEPIGGDGTRDPGYFSARIATGFGTIGTRGNVAQQASPGNRSRTGY